MKKKVLSAALAASMALSMTPAAAFAAPGAEGHWAEGVLDEWMGYGVIKGYDDGSGVGADNKVTRAEFVTMLDRVMGYKAKAENVYSDVALDWYTDYILRGVAAGVIEGDDNGEGTMRPNDPVTRQEACVILARVLDLDVESAPDAGFADQADIAEWAQDSVNAMKAEGYVAGNDGYFRPTDPTTRAEAVKMLDNIFAGLYQESGEYADDVDGSAVVSADGVDLKGQTIEGDLVIAEGVGDGHVELDGVTVEGRVIVRGGGANSVVIKGGSKIGEIVVDRQSDPVRVAVEGDAEVGTVTVAEDTVSLILEGKVASVSVETPGVELSVAGEVETLTVAEGAEGAKVSVEEGAVVSSVVTSAPKAELSVAGKVESVSVKGDSTVVEAVSGGEVAKVEADAAGTVVKGEGKVESVVAGESSSDVVVSTEGTGVVNNGSGSVTDGEGGTVAKPGAEATTPGGSTSGGGSTGGGTSGGVDQTSISVDSFDELTSALSNAQYTTVILDGDVVLTNGGKLNIPSGKTLEIGKDATLTVENGCSFEVENGGKLCGSDGMANNAAEASFSIRSGSGSQVAISGNAEGGIDSVVSGPNNGSVWNDGETGLSQDAFFSVEVSGVWQYGTNSSLLMKNPYVVTYASSATSEDSALRALPGGTVAVLNDLNKALQNPQITVFAGSADKESLPAGCVGSLLGAQITKGYLEIGANVSLGSDAAVDSIEYTYDFKNGAVAELPDGASWVAYSYELPGVAAVTESITVESGSVLTVADGGSFDVYNGTLSGEGSVVVESGGAMKMNANYNGGKDSKLPTIKELVVEYGGTLESMTTEKDEDGNDKKAASTVFVGSTDDARIQLESESTATLGFSESYTPGNVDGRIVPTLLLQGEATIPSGKTWYTMLDSGSDAIGIDMFVNGILSVEGTLKVTSANNTYSHVFLEGNGSLEVSEKGALAISSKGGVWGSRDKIASMEIDGSVTGQGLSKGSYSWENNIWIKQLDGSFASKSGGDFQTIAADSEGVQGSFILDENNEIPSTIQNGVFTQGEVSALGCAHIDAEESGSCDCLYKSLTLYVMISDEIPAFTEIVQNYADESGKVVLSDSMLPKTASKIWDYSDWKLEGEEGRIAVKEGKTYLKLSLYSFKRESLGSEWALINENATKQVLNFYNGEQLVATMTFDSPLKGYTVEPAVETAEDPEGASEA